MLLLQNKYPALLPSVKRARLIFIRVTYYARASHRRIHVISASKNAYRFASSQPVSPARHDPIPPRVRVIVPFYANRQPFRV